MVKYAHENVLLTHTRPKEEDMGSGKKKANLIVWVLKVLIISTLLGMLGLALLPTIFNAVEVIQYEPLQRLMFVVVFIDYLLILLLVLGPLYAIYGVWYELKGKQYEKQPA